VLVRVLIALFIAVSLDPAVRALTQRGMRRSLAVLLIFAVAGGLIGGTVLGLVGALMAIPVAAGLKVVLAERLEARDTDELDAAQPGDGTAAGAPGGAG
jgi:predicted PurR-regulated permease PerM